MLGKLNEFVKLSFSGGSQIAPIKILLLNPEFLIAFLGFLNNQSSLNEKVENSMFQVYIISIIPDSVILTYVSLLNRRSELKLN